MSAVPVSTSFSEEIVAAYAATLLGDDALMEALAIGRGWRPDAVERLGLGWDGRRVTFPVRDETAGLVGLARYLPDAAKRSDREPKMLATAGSARQLFPPPELLADTEVDGVVFLVEGEPDCTRMWSLGLVAVAVPGAGNWRAEWAGRFSGRRSRVVVAFDCDEPGRTNAERAVADLVAVGVDARLLDIEPTSDDGTDLTDWLAAATTAELRGQAARLLLDIAARLPVPEFVPAPEATATEKSQERLQFARADEFVAVEEPASEPLASDGEGGAVIPAAGFVLVYGDGGAGKTTLVNDLVVHMAAGRDWLSLVTPSRPLRVCVIENEGPRPMFREKLKRKFDFGWQEAAAAIFVLETPWQGFDFRRESQRDDLVAFVNNEKIDLLVAAPVARIGMEGGGTLDEIGTFVALLADIQRRTESALAVLLVHHQNRAGQVSGAWEGLPDSLVHVQAQGHGRTRVYWQKLRWSSRLHGTSTTLLWADGDAFTVEEREQVSEDTIAADILAAATELPGGSWTKIRDKVKGNAVEIAEVRDRLLKEGALVNTATRDNYFNLWVADDPAASRTNVGTALERPTFPFPEDGTPTEPYPVPPYKGTGTVRNGPTGSNPDPEPREPGADAVTPGGSQNEVSS